MFTLETKQYFYHFGFNRPSPITIQQYWRTWNNILSYFVPEQPRNYKPLNWIHIYYQIIWQYVSFLMILFRYP